MVRVYPDCLLMISHVASRARVSPLIPTTSLRSMECEWSGDPPAGRPQGCAPTMPRSGLPGSSIVGAMACPRPAVGWSPCLGRPALVALRWGGRPASVALPWSPCGGVVALHRSPCGGVVALPWSPCPGRPASVALPWSPAPVAPFGCSWTRAVTNLSAKPTKY